MGKQESRIQILDRLSKKLGKKDGVKNWKEWVAYYDFEAVTLLVYQAMMEYATQDEAQLKASEELHGELDELVNKQIEVLAQSYHDPIVASMTSGLKQICGCCTHETTTSTNIEHDSQDSSEDMSVCFDCYNKIVDYWKENGLKKNAPI